METNTEIQIQNIRFYGSQLHASATSPSGCTES